MKKLIGLFIVLAIGSWLLFFVVIKYVIDNRDDIAKEVGKSTQSIKENFEDGRNSIKSDTITIDSLKLKK